MNEAQKIVAAKTEEMRAMPLLERLAAIDAADNVIDARLLFRPVRVVTSEVDCA